MPTQQSTSKDPTGNQPIQLVRSSWMPTKVVLTALTVVVLSFVGFWQYLLYHDPGSGYTNWALVGSTSTILATLFSGLAFAGIIVTIYLQGRQIHETSKDVKQQTNILAQQVEALKEQTNTLRALMHAQLRPYMTFWLSVDVEGSVDLHICNKGRTAALNLKLDLDKDIINSAVIGRQGMEPNVRKRHLFQEIQPTFPAETEATYLLGWSAYFIRSGAEEQGYPSRFTIVATYSDATGSEFHEAFVMDVHQLDLQWKVRNRQHEQVKRIADSTEKIKDALTAIADRMANP